MNRARRLVLGLLPALAATVAAAPARADAAPALEPYQLVRSLQLVQDRIADGDHAALPMQKKLLEMIDRRFRGAGVDTFEDRRNFRAVLVYGMSGGNPGTIEHIVAQLKLDNTDRRYVDGVLSYLRGKPQLAATAFAETDPMKEPAELGAFTALIRGSIVAAEKPADALKFLAQARLLNPGTLVEEAAIRRSIAVATALGDAERFLFLCEDYARRYLRSPYASQFADALVAGVLALHDKIDLDRLGTITAVMDREQQKVVYLRIARRAALDNRAGLTEFATRAAEGIGDVGDATTDPRAQLYASLTTLTSENVIEVLERLRGLDRSKLSPGDRALLEAAEAAAAAMTAPVVPAPAAPPVAAAEPQSAPPAEAASDPALAEEQPLPVEPGTEPHQAADSSHAGSETDADPAPGSPDRSAETAAILDDARRKLDAVDALLKGTADDR